MEIANRNLQTEDPNWLNVQEKERLKKFSKNKQSLFVYKEYCRFERFDKSSF